MRVVVRVTSEINHGRRFWLIPGQSVVVGGDESAEIAFPHSGMMPQQFQLKCDFHHCTLTALAEATCCNGTPVTQTTLSSGDRIEAGQMRFVVELDAPTSAAAGKVSRPQKPTAAATGTGKPSDSHPDLWQIVRSTDKATLLRAHPSDEADGLAAHRSALASIERSDSTRMFRLLPPACQTPASENSQSPPADPPASKTPPAGLFVARHLGGETQQRLSVSLAAMDQPPNQWPTDAQLGTVGWVTQGDDALILRVLGLAAQGRGATHARANAQWLLCSADAAEMTRLLVDSDAAYLNNLIDGFDAIWAECADPPQLHVLVGKDCLAQLSPS
ncbi:FHA domain-containing protein [Stieleria mannarensis]|uniref:FHA domain-containing protein n=1 Tax=Stieleria mannarensis TaxID=2755585 RepID=UPI0016027A80|nr:FHA domain-containing protein [Rhodopirellula sp. JC639]